MDKDEPNLNPTQMAAELNLPIRRDWGGQTLTQEQVLDAAVNMYWKRRAFDQIKEVS